MIFGFTSTTTEPIPYGKVGEGWLSIQVQNGVGVWVGKTKNGLAQGLGPPGITVYDGFFIQPSDGLVKIPWSGDVYLFHPGQAVTEVYGTIELSGCED